MNEQLKGRRKLKIGRLLAGCTLALLVMGLYLHYRMCACGPQPQPCTGCGDGVATQIEMDGRNPPTFSLTGSRDGSVTRISVVEIGPDRETAVWELEPAGAAASLAVAELPPLTYGRVPPNFQQVGSHTPPALVSGHTYALIIRGIDVVSVRRTFRVVGETTVRVPVQ